MASDCSKHKKKYMDYKIKFHADIAYPKSRIVGKTGDVTISSDNEIETIKADYTLAAQIQNALQTRMKTGTVFNLKIIDILLKK